jgi:hypothetical protein
MSRTPTLDAAVTGGCLCGHVRYRLPAVPTDVAHCHCRICQRSTGAPVVTWATVARADLEVEGAPAWYRSSPAARRGFCPACGTQLFFAFDADAGATRADAPAAPAAEIDVAVATFDEPDRCRPTRNIWTTSRRAFLHGFDADLPDFVDEGPAPAPEQPRPDPAR